MNKIFERLEKIKKEVPLIHHITNYVTVRDCADITKNIGASPIMADAIEEVEEITSNSNALVLNIGTLNSNIIESMKISGKIANKKGIPIILDICGAGTTKFRTEKCKELLNSFHIDIIKGNISEIATIAGLNTTTKGIEATQIEINVIEMAKQLATKLKSIVVVTGKEDIVSNGKNAYAVKNGVLMMSKIIGTGCMASSVIASFCAVEKDYILACISALVCYEIAAENAFRTTKELESFKVRLLDEIASKNLNQNFIGLMKKVTII